MPLKIIVITFTLWGLLEVVHSWVMYGCNYTVAPIIKEKLQLMKQKNKQN